MKKETLRKQKGITLVALIITIVILIILVGVTLDITLGENGIFNKSKNAVDVYKEVALKEQIELDVTDAYLTGKEDNLGVSLQEKGYSVAKTEDGYTVVDSEKDLIYTLDENGVIQSQEAIQYTSGDAFVFDKTTGTITDLADKGKTLKEIIIPKTIEGELVTSIGDGAFYGYTNIESVIIPNTVTTIDDSAFEDCKNLISILIPNSVTSIKDYAFYGCESLTSVTIPNSVTSIKNYAFYECESLTSVTIPNSVTSIGGEAFRYCTNLTTVKIPNSVTEILDEAFCDIKSGSIIYVETEEVKDLLIDDSMEDKIYYYDEEKTNVVVDASKF